MTKTQGVTREPRAKQGAGGDCTERPREASEALTRAAPH